MKIVKSEENEHVLVLEKIKKKTLKKGPFGAKPAFYGLCTARRNPNHEHRKGYHKKNVKISNASTYMKELL